MVRVGQIASLAKVGKMTAVLLICAALTAHIPDGSVVALHRSKISTVVVVTGSHITHTGVVFNLGGSPWVFDAYPPAVRVMPWDRYKAFAAQQGDELWLYVKAA